MSDLSKSKIGSSQSSTPKARASSGSSRRVGRKSAKSETIVSFTLDELLKMPGQTDWARIDALTDEEIEAAARSDPEWEGLLDIDWSKAELVEPVNKVAISIRLDPDILAFFKEKGPGYQRRINAVLRAYMRQAKTDARPKARPTGKKAS